MEKQLYFLCLFALFLSCQSSQKKEPVSNVDVSGMETKEMTPANALSKAEEAAGWQLLFDGNSTDQWRGYNKASFPTNGWEVKNGLLMVLAKGEGGDIITRDQYANFELKLDFMVSDTANSGIFYLATEEENAPIWHNAPEFQILDNQTYIKMGTFEMKTHLTGDNYDLQAAAEDYSHPAGEWNSARIIHHSGKVEHWLNGHKTVEYEIGSPEWKTMVKKSKFATYPKYGLAKKGYIGLQDHGHLVSFRNIKIRRL